MKKQEISNISENKKINKSGGKSEVDLEGEDFYKSTPVVTNYYYPYKHER